MSINQFSVGCILDSNSYSSPIFQLTSSSWNNYTSNWEVVYITHNLCELCPIYYYKIYIDRVYIIKTTLSPIDMEDVASFINQRPHQVERYVIDLFRSMSEDTSLYDLLLHLSVDYSNITTTNHTILCLHDPPQMYDSDIEYSDSDYSDSGIECTSGLQFNSIFHGFLAHSYGFINTARWRNENAFEKIISNWILEAANLTVNFNLTTVALTLLKLLNEFKPLTEFIKPFCDLFNTAIQHVATTMNKGINYFFSTQHTLEEEIEPTLGDFSSFGDFISLNKFNTGSVEVLSCVVAAATILFSTVIVGKTTDFSSHNTSGSKIVTKLSGLFRFAASAKSGIYALLEMFKDFKKYLNYTIMSMIVGDNDSLLVSLISKTLTLETETCKKELFFGYLDFLCQPINLLTISKTKIYKDQLIFVIKIIDEILLDSANQQSILPLETSRYLSSKLVELKKVRNFVFKSKDNEITRFTPFWINLIGESGCGKSQFMPLLMKAMLEVLDKELPGEIPEKDLWYYAVNFTDKFMTNYKQHYVVGIDDLFQDASPLGERSSALDIISWCSNITYHTNQAALEDKGIPFESKIIISSSNDYSITRKEIVDKMALQRRMNIRAEFIESNTFAIDPLLNNKRVKIAMYKHIDKHTKQHISTVTSKEFMAYCVTEYIKWFKHQNDLILSRNPSEDLLKEIRSMVTIPKVVEVMSETPDTQINYTNTLNNLVSNLSGNEELEPTFGWLEFTNNYHHLNNTLETIASTVRGGVVTSLYKCECDMHQISNEQYCEYIIFCELNNEEPRSITTYSPKHVSRMAYAYVKTYDFFINKVNTFLKDNVATLILAAFGVIVGYKAITSFMSKDKIEMDSEVIGTAAKYTTAVKRVARKKAIIPKIEATGTSMSVTQPTADQQTLDLSNLLISSGSVCRLEDLQRKLTNVAIRFHDTCFISNHHFFVDMEDGDKFDVVVDTKNEKGFRSTQTYSSKRICQIGDLDVVVYKCDNSIRHARSLLSHFPLNEIIVEEQRAMIITNKRGTVYVENTYAEPITRKKLYTMGSQQYDILDSYHVNTAVEKGTSGSILLAYNSRLQCKILGIQTSRETKYNTGYFRPISREMLQSCLEALDADLQITSNINIDVTSGPCPKNFELKRLKYLGVIPKDKIVRQNTKSKIIPSLIHDESLLTQQPSVLSPYDERMNDEFYGKPLLYRGIQGFDEEIGTIDTKTLDLVAKYLATEYDTELIYPGIERRLLNNWEIVNGIPGFLSKLDLRTSPGYPFVLERKRTELRGKFEWFNKLEDQEFGDTYEMCKELSDGLERREKLAMNGENSSTIAVACLKDETRSLDKIRNGKTRVFVCLPLDYNLLIRKYFGAFVAAQHALAGTITSCVGIDPATQWRKLFDKLSAKNVKFEDFDYSNWDQHLHPELVMKVAEIVNYWYGTDNSSEEGKVRRVLIYDLIHTVIMVKDRLFQKSSGQCSGCAITAELNCIVHDLLMCFTWFKMCNDQNIETSLADYRRNVAAIIYGDDIVISVEQDSPILFNGTTIQPYMMQLGMNITPGDKLSKDFTTKEPHDILFLKRAFIENGDLVKAPLRLDIVQNIVQWIHESDDKVNATTVNCEMALQEAYMHGPVVFENLKTSINERIRRLNTELAKQNRNAMNAICLDYDHFDAKYNDNTFVCIGQPMLQG